MSEKYNCSNVYKDIGFTGREAKSLVIRAQLIRALMNFIKANQLTQSEAASLFELTQPRVSDLMRGKISLFSMDTLVNMLGKAEFDISIHSDHNHTSVPINVKYTQYNCGKSKK